MGLDYDFVYGIDVSFEMPDDVLRFIGKLKEYNDGLEDSDCHLALMDSSLVLVDGATSEDWFDDVDQSELFTCGYDEVTDILDDFIKQFNDDKGISINGWLRTIEYAQDVTFNFWKNGKLIDTMDDTDLADIYLEKL